MREILFRGKIQGLTDWSYGYYAKSGENHFVLLDTDNEDNYSIVDPETVGQYTGEDDKFDDAIFEGDIVRFDYEDDNGNYAPEDFLIIFENGAFRAQYLGNRECKPHTFDELSITESRIVGNKWDNPELLEEQE